MLYAATSRAAANPTVAIRLKERLHDEVWRMIGIVSADLDRATHLTLQNVTWQAVTDRSVAEVARTVLIEAEKNPKLAREAAAARTRILAAPTTTVAGILHLDAPVIDNPALHTDVTRGLAVELARLAGLSDQATQVVTQHSAALVNSSAATLDALVAQGRLTKQEQAVADDDPGAGQAHRRQPRAHPRPAGRRRTTSPLPWSSGQPTSGSSSSTGSRSPSRPARPPPPTPR